MGQRSSHCLTKAGDRQHLSYNKWTKNEIKLLQTMFDQMAMRSPDPESMSKETFLSVYQLPGFMSERLFKVFDWKKSGDIDFGEFLLGLEKFFRSSVQDKAGVIFKMWDLNDNGVVDEKELSTMLHSLIPPPQKEKERDSLELHVKLRCSEHHRSFIRMKVETAFRECDLNHDGKLSFHQFKLFLTRNQDIVQMMDETFSEHSFLGNLNPSPPASKLRSWSEPNMLPDNRLTSENDFDQVIQTVRSLHNWKGSLPARDPSSALMTGENLGRHNLLSPSPPLSSQLSDFEHSELMDATQQNLNKATCFSCKIVFTLHEDTDKKLVSLETDPDYSVFDLRILAGIMTSIDLRCCIQCGSKLRPNIDDHTDEDKSSNSQLDMTISKPKCGQVAHISTSEPDSWNPNRIIMQGILSKKGRTTKAWKDRWYVLKDKFLYHYKIAKHREGTSGEPISVEFIRGCNCEIDETESQKQSNRFCFTLTFPEGNVKKLWTKAYQEREHWVESLRLAAETGNVMDLYKIHKLIGKGKFSKVHSCTERKTSKK